MKRIIESLFYVSHIWQAKQTQNFFLQIKRKTTAVVPVYPIISVFFMNMLNTCIKLNIMKVV